MKQNILFGHTSMDSAYEVKNYPYGFKLKTSIFYWIETKAGKGDRLCTYTINPKNGRKNAPKYSTYNVFMWLYLDENGHVKNGQIDSFDMDIFNARFEYLVNKIGLPFISETQQQNIRVNHYQHLIGNAPYELAKYSDETKPLFKQWLSETVRHIKTCPFAKLVSYPEKPAQDNPKGEIKMIITEYSLIK